MNHLWLFPQNVPKLHIGKSPRSCISWTLAKSQEVIHFLLEGQLIDSVQCTEDWTTPCPTTCFVLQEVQWINWQKNHSYFHWECYWVLSLCFLTEQSRKILHFQSCDDRLTKFLWQPLTAQKEILKAAPNCTERNHWCHASVWWGCFFYKKKKAMQRNSFDKCVCHFSRLQVNCHRRQISSKKCE